jgi:hypothetical protein
VHHSCCRTAGQLVTNERGVQPHSVGDDPWLSIMLTLCHILHSVSLWPVLEYFISCCRNQLRHLQPQTICGGALAVIYVNLVSHNALCQSLVSAESPYQTVCTAAGAKHSQNSQQMRADRRTTTGSANAACSSVQFVQLLSKLVHPTEALKYRPHVTAASNGTLTTTTTLPVLYNAMQQLVTSE